MWCCPIQQSELHRTHSQVSLLIQFPKPSLGARSCNSNPQGLMARVRHLSKAFPCHVEAWIGASIPWTQMCNTARHWHDHRYLSALEVELSFAQIKIIQRNTDLEECSFLLHSLKVLCLPGKLYNDSNTASFLAGIKYRALEKYNFKRCLCVRNLLIIATNISHKW